MEIHWGYFMGNMTNKMFCLLWSARLNMRKVSSNLLLSEKWSVMGTSFSDKPILYIRK